MQVLCGQDLPVPNAAAQPRLQHVLPTARSRSARHGLAAPVCAVQPTVVSQQPHSVSAATNSTVRHAPHTAHAILWPMGDLHAVIKELAEVPHSELQAAMCDAESQLHTCTDAPGQLSSVPITAWLPLLKQLHLAKATLGPRLQHLFYSHVEQNRAAHPSGSPPAPPSQIVDLLVCICNLAEPRQEPSTQSTHTSMHHTASGQGSSQPQGQQRNVADGAHSHAEASTPAQPGLSSATEFAARTAAEHGHATRSVQHLPPYTLRGLRQQAVCQLLAQLQPCFHSQALARDQWLVLLRALAGAKVSISLPQDFSHCLYQALSHATGSQNASSDAAGSQRPRRAAEGSEGGGVVWQGLAPDMLQQVMWATSRLVTRRMIPAPDATCLQGVYTHLNQLLLQSRPAKDTVRAVAACVVSLAHIHSSTPASLPLPPALNSAQLALALQTASGRTALPGSLLAELLWAWGRLGWAASHVWLQQTVHAMHGAASVPPEKLVQAMWALAVMCRRPAAQQGHDSAGDGSDILDAPGGTLDMHGTQDIPVQGDPVPGQLSLRLLSQLMTRLQPAVDRLSGASLATVMWAVVQVTSAAHAAASGKAAATPAAGRDAVLAAEPQQPVIVQLRVTHARFFDVLFSSATTRVTSTSPHIAISMLWCVSYMGLPRGLSAAPHGSPALHASSGLHVRHAGGFVGQQHAQLAAQLTAASTQYVVSGLSAVSGSDHSALMSSLQRLGWRAPAQWSAAAVPALSDKLHQLKPHALGHLLLGCGQVLTPPTPNPSPRPRSRPSRVPTATESAQAMLHTSELFATPRPRPPSQAPGAGAAADTAALRDWCRLLAGACQAVAGTLGASGAPPAVHDMQRMAQGLAALTGQLTVVLTGQITAASDDATDASLELSLQQVLQQLSDACDGLAHAWLQALGTGQQLSGSTGVSQARQLGNAAGALSGMLWLHAEVAAARQHLDARQQQPAQLNQCPSHPAVAADMQRHAEKSANPIGLLAPPSRDSGHSRQRPQHSVRDGSSGRRLSPPAAQGLLNTRSGNNLLSPSILEAAAAPTPAASSPSLALCVDRLRGHLGMLSDGTLPLVSAPDWHQGTAGAVFVWALAALTQAHVLLRTQLSDSWYEVVHGALQQQVQVLVLDPDATAALAHAVRVLLGVQAGLPPSASQLLSLLDSTLLSQPATVAATPSRVQADTASRTTDASGLPLPAAASVPPTQESIHTQMQSVQSGQQLVGLLQALLRQPRRSPQRAAVATTEHPAQPSSVAASVDTPAGGSAAPPARSGPAGSTWVRAAVWQGPAVSKVGELLDRLTEAEICVVLTAVAGLRWSLDSDTSQAVEHRLSSWPDSAAWSTLSVRHTAELLWAVSKLGVVVPTTCLQTVDHHMAQGLVKLNQQVSAAGATESTEPQDFADPQLLVRLLRVAARRAHESTVGTTVEGLGGTAVPALPSWGWTVASMVQQSIRQLTLDQLCTGLWACSVLMTVQSRPVSDQATQTASNVIQPEPGFQSLFQHCQDRLLSVLELQVTNLGRPQQQQSAHPAATATQTVTFNSLLTAAQAIARVRRRAAGTARVQGQVASGFPPTLLNSLAVGVRGATLQEVSSLLKVMARHGLPFNAPLRTHLYQRVEDLLDPSLPLPPQLASARAALVVQVTRQLAHLKVRPPQRLCQVLLHAVLPAVRGLRAGMLVRWCQSLARLGVGVSGPSAANLLQRVDRLLSARQLDGRDVARLLWALARLATRKPPTAKATQSEWRPGAPLLTACCAVLAQQMDTTRLEEVAGAMWALAKLEFRPHPELLHAVLGHTLRTAAADSCRLRHPALLLYSLAALSFQPAASWLRPMYAITQHKLTELAVAVGGTTAAVARATGQRRKFVSRPQHDVAYSVPRLVWALATLQQQPPLSWILCAVRTVQPVLSECDAHELTLLAVGLSLLGLPLHPSWLRDFEAALEGQPLGMDLNTQMRLTWAWQRLRERVDLDQQSLAVSGGRLRSRKGQLRLTVTRRFRMRRQT